MKPSTRVDSDSKAISRPPVVVRDVPMYRLGYNPRLRRFCRETGEVVVIVLQKKRKKRKVKRIRIRIKIKKPLLPKKPTGPTDAQMVWLVNEVMVGAYDKQVYVYVTLPMKFKGVSGMPIGIRNGEGDGMQTRRISIHKIYTWMYKNGYISIPISSLTVHKGAQSGRITLIENKIDTLLDNNFDFSYDGLLDY